MKIDNERESLNAPELLAYATEAVRRYVKNFLNNEHRHPRLEMIIYNGLGEFCRKNKLVMILPPVPDPRPVVMIDRYKKVSATIVISYDGENRINIGVDLSEKEKQAYKEAVMRLAAADGATSREEYEEEPE